MPYTWRLASLIRSRNSLQMDKRFRPQVPPTLKYLEDLGREGQKVVDVCITTVLPETYAMDVYLSGGEQRTFYIEGDHQTIRAHYLQAIEFSGYGPRGFSNLIHAEVMQKCRETGRKSDKFEVRVSLDVIIRVREHLGHFTGGHGYLLSGDPTLKGLTFVIREV